MPKSARFLVLVAAASLGACVLRVTRPLSTPDSYHYVPPTPAPSFQIDPGDPVIMEIGSPIERMRFHDVLPISYASGGHTGSEDNRVNGLYFRSRLPGPKKYFLRR